MKYDYLIVGCGMFGSVCARVLTDAGYKCLVIDKRNHIAGNCYSKKISEIDVHWYGAHIFHTSNKEIWDFINKFSEFNNYRHHVVANYKGEIYSLPFNMWTFNQFWGSIKPEQAKRIIEDQKFIGIPSNLEEQAISMVGKDIYDKLIRGYTKKQWMEEPVNLPPSIIKRLPIRFTYDNNYFFDTYQGIPKDGYSQLFVNMLDQIDVELQVDYFKIQNKNIAKNTIYTGPIDKYYNYEYGRLPYRPLHFEHMKLKESNFQGHSVVNYTDESIPYTRIIEHNHFNPKKTKETIITKEYPIKWTGEEDPIYPINTEENNSTYQKYKNINRAKNIFFGGRLAEYRYYDMHQVIGSAIKLCKELCK